MAFANRKGSSSRCGSATSSCRAASLLKASNDQRRERFGSRPGSSSSSRCMSAPTGRNRAAEDAPSIFSIEAPRSASILSIEAPRSRGQSFTGDSEMKPPSAMFPRERPHSAPSGDAWQQFSAKPRTECLFPRYDAVSGDASQQLPAKLPSEVSRAKPRSDCLFPRYDGGKLPSEISTAKVMAQMISFHRGDDVPEFQPSQSRRRNAKGSSSCGYSDAAFQLERASQCSLRPPKKLMYYAPYQTSLVSSIQSGGLMALITDPLYLASKREPGLIQRDLRFNTACDPGVCVARQAKYPDVIGDRASPAEQDHEMGAKQCARRVRELEAMKGAPVTFSTAQYTFEDFEKERKKLST